MFSVWSFISSNFSPNENFKNSSFPPWFWKISVPCGFCWVQKFSPPPSQRQGGGGHYDYKLCYSLHKAQRKSESSFSHSLLAIFPLLVMQQTSFEKDLLPVAGFLQSSVLFNTSKLDWVENLFYFYVESIVFKIKMLIDLTST